jgi:hypothetical protein
MRTTTGVLALVLVLSFFALIEMQFVWTAHANPSVFAMMPHVKLFSPTNMTYTATSILVNATFEVSQKGYDNSYPPRVIVYLDSTYFKIPAVFESENETWKFYYANTTLQDLSDGPHELRVAFENTIASFYNPTAVFVVETRPPIVTILSPENATYPNSSVPLTFVVNEPFSTVSYSLDQHAPVSVDGNTTLTGLPDGNHTLIVSAIDMAGKSGSSKQRSFSSQEPPKIFISSPKNETLFLSNNQLTFTTSEPINSAWYSLDGGANVTVRGNVTLAWLPSGSHILIIYACDVQGNLGASETIQFTVAAITWEWGTIVLVPLIAVSVTLLVVFRRRKRRHRFDSDRQVNP